MFKPVMLGVSLPDCEVLCLPGWSFHCWLAAYEWLQDAVESISAEPQACWTLIVQIETFE